MLRALLMSAFLVLGGNSGHGPLSPATPGVTSWRMSAQTPSALMLRARSTRCARIVVLQVDDGKPRRLRVGIRLVDHRLGTLQPGVHRLSLRTLRGVCRGRLFLRPLLEPLATVTRPEW
jgi:hypothetical protein